MLPDIKPEVVAIAKVDVAANLDEFPEELHRPIAENITRMVKGVRVPTLGGECRPVGDKFECEVAIPEFNVSDKAGNAFLVKGVRVTVDGLNQVVQEMRRKEVQSEVVEAPE